MAFLNPFSSLPAVRRWRAASWALLALALCVTGGAARGQTPISAENQLKAVFLFNFAQFLDWPASVFPEAKTPVLIGVLGDDPFGSYLDELVKGEKIGERPMVVRRFHRVEDVAGCQILFVSRSESGRLERILAALKGRSILTVGDVEGFASQGGMVRFVTEGGKIQLRINVAAAKAADLTISSKLLAHATILAPGKD